MRTTGIKTRVSGFRRLCPMWKWKVDPCLPNDVIGLHLQSNPLSSSQRLHHTSRPGAHGVLKAFSVILGFRTHRPQRPEPFGPQPVIELGAPHVAPPARGCAGPVHALISHSRNAVGASRLVEEPCRSSHPNEAMFDVYKNPRPALPPWIGDIIPETTQLVYCTGLFGLVSCV